MFAAALLLNLSSLAPWALWKTSLRVRIKPDMMLKYENTSPSPYNPYPDYFWNALLSLDSALTSFALNTHFFHFLHKPPKLEGKLSTSALFSFDINAAVLWPRARWIKRLLTSKYPPEVSAVFRLFFLVSCEGSWCCIRAKFFSFFLFETGLILLQRLKETHSADNRLPGHCQKRQHWNQMRWQASFSHFPWHSHQGVNGPNTLQVFQAVWEPCRCFFNWTLAQFVSGGRVSTGCNLLSVRLENKATAWVWSQWGVKAALKLESMFDVVENFLNVVVMLCINLFGNPQHPNPLLYRQANHGRCKQ